ncbi:MAG TPA: hypothetical protein ENH52_04870, partial [Nitrospirae bacterium]|nr:hypothetical protein [Nitrospirota bacterium]
MKKAILLLFVLLMALIFAACQGGHTGEEGGAASGEQGFYYFEGSNGADSWEPWISNGTAAGTVMISDINPEGGSYPWDFLRINPLYFSADDGTNGRELWISDRT